MRGASSPAFPVGGTDEGREPTGRHIVADSRRLQYAEVVMASTDNRITIQAMQLRRPAVRAGHAHSRE